MNLYLSILVVVFLLSLYAFILSMGIAKIKLKIVLTVLIIGILLRYVSLFFYLISESPLFLYDIRSLTLLSAISIPLLSYICINKINKGKLGKIDLVAIAIMAIIYIYIIIMCPDRIISDEIGYRLLLKNKFVYYLSAVQGVFSIYMIYITIKYIFKRTLGYRKIINIMFFIGYISAAFEGLALLFNKSLMKSPVLSEGFIILAIIIALREIKKD